MNEWIKIQEYRDFCDLPRIFIVRAGASWLLFDCPFNESLDDYPDKYWVYEISDASRWQFSNYWSDCSSEALVCKAVVDMNELTFDASKRKGIKLSEEVWSMISGNVGG